jgi:hypothetical protein
MPPVFVRLHGPRDYAKRLCQAGGPEQCLPPLPQFLLQNFPAHLAHSWNWQLQSGAQWADDRSAKFAIADSGLSARLMRRLHQIGVLLRYHRRYC